MTRPRTRTRMNEADPIELVTDSRSVGAASAPPREARPEPFEYSPSRRWANDMNSPTSTLAIRSQKLFINGHLVIRCFSENERLYVTDDRIVWGEVSPGMVVCAAVPSGEVDLEDIEQVRAEVESYRPRRVEARVPIEVEKIQPWWERPLEPDNRTFL